MRSAGPLVHPWHLRLSPHPSLSLGITPDPQCGTSEAGTTSAASADAQSQVRAGVSSKSPWGFARVEGLVELCVH